ncbi:MAG TPA: copper-transporting ATPase [Deltaproteobacteria bacterium]|nr:copper-transporting ATPase [Deltaproteobacteria bacterium]
MIIDKVLVTVFGLALSFLVAWYFWFSKKKIAKAALTSAGVQEALIVVKGGYTPDLLVVQAGKPVRLKFNRQESAACSEMLILPAFNKSAKLPEGETVPIEFVPTEPGEYEFSCQMGMFRGKLIVE